QSAASARTSWSSTPSESPVPSDAAACRRMSSASSLAARCAARSRPHDPSKAGSPTTGPVPTSGPGPTTAPADTLGPAPLNVLVSPVGGGASGKMIVPDGVMMYPGARSCAEVARLARKQMRNAVRPLMLISMSVDLALCGLERDGDDSKCGAVARV